MNIPSIYTKSLSGNEEMCDKKKVVSSGMNLFENQPNEILVFIFCGLNKRDWKNLSLTSKKFQDLSKHPSVLASLLEKTRYIPLSKQLEFTQLAGPRLTKIKAFFTITLLDLTNLLKNCPNIQELDLENCNWLTDRAIRQLSQSLISLNLAGCNWLTNRAIRQLPQSLTSLNLAGCNWLTDRAIARLLQSLQLSDVATIANII